MCSRLQTLLLHSLLSGFYAVIAPFCYTLTSFTKEDRTYNWFSGKSGFWLIYVWDSIMILCLFYFNTISVKYKLFSYKFNGAFLGTTLILVFTIAFSYVVDLIMVGHFPNPRRVLGVIIITMGTAVISWDYNTHKEHHQDCALVHDIMEGTDLVQPEVSPSEQNSVGDHNPNFGCSEVTHKVVNLISFEHETHDSNISKQAA